MGGGVMIKRAQFRAYSFIQVAGAATFFFLTSGCISQHFFSELGTPVSVSQVSTDPSNPSAPHSCKGTLLTTEEKLRIIFMIDYSGSTEDTVYWKGTDPGKTFRLRTIRSFLQKYGSKQNLTYSFAIFGGSASVYDTRKRGFISAENSYSPFGTSSDMESALRSFEQKTYIGGTAYKSAFEAIDTVISRDNSPADHQKYIVVFMSDGQPTDLVTPMSGGRPETCSLEPMIDTKIARLVNNLQQTVASSGGAITVSSVYFGDQIYKAECDGFSGGDTDAWWAIRHLQGMAKEGEGQFIDTNRLNGSALEIEDIITIPGQDCS